ncbi:hypothetical protein [Pseudomonas sp. LRF_L74]|uniref:hypothetical protein n=1 Tax=Pseudomonas sp. LRF_L74 TaxID=3369422 RepID=UPI003F5EB9D9
MDWLISTAEKLTTGISNFNITVVACLILALKLITAAKKIFDFHDEYFVKRRIDRLESLKSKVEVGKTLHVYLEESIASECFRITSGISTSTKYMEYLIKLSAVGKWSRFQLKAISEHLRFKPLTTEPEIVIPKMDFVGAALGAICLFFFPFAGIYYFIFFLLANIQNGPFYGLISFIACLGGGLILSGDFIKYLVATRAKAYLQANPIV